eukprot:jgi/Botrbrau1/16059/Bobra.7_2s0033.3
MTTAWGLKFRQRRSAHTDRIDARAGDRRQEHTSSVSEESMNDTGHVFSFKDRRIEAAFLVVLGKSSRRAALLSCFFCALAWSLGAIQIMAMLHGQPMRGRRYAYLLALIVQASTLARELVTMILLCKQSTSGHAPAPELMHDLVKYRTLEHEAIASMVCAILLGPHGFTYVQGLNSLYSNSYISLVSQIRLKSALKLQPGKLVCLLFLEVSRWLYGDATTTLTVTRDLVYYIVFALAVPLTLHTLQEAHFRKDFLEQYKHPPSLMPVTFQRALQLAFSCTTF